jgi:Calx-beta domain
MNKPDDTPISVESLLESAINQQLTTTELIATLKTQCRRNSDATWQTLALVDQYFRRGRISRDIYTKIKTELNSLVFSARTGTPSSVPSNELRGEHIAERKTTQPPREPVSINEAVPVPPRVEVAGNRGCETVAQSPLPLHHENEELISAEVNVKPVDIDGKRDTEFARSFAIAKNLLTPTNIAAVVVATFVLIGLIWKVLPTSNSVAINSTLNNHLDVAKGLNPSTQAEIESPINAQDKPTTVVVEPANASPKPLAQAIIQDQRIFAADSTKPASPSQSVDQDIQAPTSLPSTIAALTNEALTTADLSFVDDPVVLSAGDSIADLTVRRAGSTRKELTVHWRTVAGSAKADRDFVATANGVLLFAAGARTASIVVPIVQRPDRQYSDWFEVELFSTLTAEGQTAITEGDKQNSTVRATVAIAGRDTVGEPDATEGSTVKHEK